MSCPVGCIDFITESLLHSSIFRGSRGGLRREILLPDDTIREILIRLPVKSILRFRCVCKLWLSITEDPAFIHEHMMRTTERIWASGIRYPVRSMFRGLILEFSRFPPFLYRLRNPATRRFLRLPPSDDEYKFDRLMLPWYVSETRTFKIAFPSPNGNGGSMCFKILHVSVDGGTWRTLDFPFATCKFGKITRNLVGVIEGLYVTLLLPVLGSSEEPTLVCLEMESERIWRCNIPEPFCRFRYCNKIVDWDGKPSLSACYDGILHVLVLEDYKSGKWADDVIVIDLTPVDAQSFMHDAYCYLKDGELHILDYYNRAFVFDIIEKAVARIDTPKTRAHNLRGQPSLVEFEGMQSYVVTKGKLSLLEKFKDYVLISEKSEELYM